MPARLFILLPPSARAARWRSALSNTAHALGWTVLEEVGADIDVRIADLGSEPLLVLSSAPPAWTSGGEGFVCLVITDEPDAVVAALAEDQSRRGLADATMHASIHMAAASDLAVAGATVASASALVLDIPLLGEVSLERDDQIVAASTWRNLDIYRSLPPQAGAAAEWRLEAFNYPVKQGSEVFESGDPCIDLTGRVRTLVYGPYTYLTAGRWRVRVEVIVNPEGGLAHLWFEWGSGVDVCVVHSTVDTPGVYAIDLDHDWPQSGPAELRINTLQPHFRGSLELCSVVVERLN